MAYARSMTNPALLAELISLFKQQLAMCKLEAGEDCLIITDTAFNPNYAAACLGAALDLGANAYMLTLPFDSFEPPASFAAALARGQLIIAMTTHRLHYYPELRQALDAGARALLAVQPLHVLKRLTAHPEVIQRTKHGANILGQAKQIRISSPHGTDLIMDKTGRPALAHYGAADEAGHFDFWGAAMVETAQLEGSLEGKLVLNVGDVIFHLGRFVEQPVEITFEAGRVVDIQGGLDAFLLKHQLESYADPKAFLAGHIAWGTDHRAIWTAPLVEFPERGAGNADSEGYYGTIQIEIGSNNDQFFQGQNQTAAHLGLCTLRSSLELDGELVIEKGTFTGSLAEA